MKKTSLSQNVKVLYHTCQPQTLPALGTPSVFKLISNNCKHPNFLKTMTMDTEKTKKHYQGHIAINLGNPLSFEYSIWIIHTWSILEEKIFIKRKTQINDIATNNRGSQYVLLTVHELIRRYACWKGKINQIEYSFICWLLYHLRNLSVCISQWHSRDW